MIQMRGEEIHPGLAQAVRQRQAVRAAGNPNNQKLVRFPTALLAK